MKQKQRKIWAGCVILLAGIMAILFSTGESQAAVKKPRISQKNLQMVVGKQDQLTVKNKKGYAISWKSSKKAVATVSKTGKVKAKRIGTAKITAVVKPNQGGRRYRLACKVSVKKMKRQGNSVGKQTNRVQNSEKEVNPSDRVQETPMPTVRPGQNQPMATAQPGQNQPIPDIPMPADPVTGSVVANGEAKLLFGNYNDGFDGNIFGNQMIDSYEQLQNLIQQTKEKLADCTDWKPGYDKLQWYIRCMEEIGQDYFAEHVLYICTMSVARGYDYTLDFAGVVIGEDEGKKELHLCLKRYYSLDDQHSVTCDMPYYSFFIQVPRELVQECESVVCSLVADGVIVPSNDPHCLYLIQDVILWMPDQNHYPL